MSSSPSPPLGTPVASPSSKMPLRVDIGSNQCSSRRLLVPVDPLCTVAQLARLIEERERKRHKATGEIPPVPISEIQLRVEGSLCEVDPDDIVSDLVSSDGLGAVFVAIFQGEQVSPTFPSLPPSPSTMRSAGFPLPTSDFSAAGTEQQQEPRRAPHASVGNNSTTHDVEGGGADANPARPQPTTMFAVPKASQRGGEPGKGPTKGSKERDVVVGMAEPGPNGAAVTGMASPLQGCATAAGAPRPSGFASGAAAASSRNCNVGAAMQQNEVATSMADSDGGFALPRVSVGSSVGGRSVGGGSTTTTTSNNVATAIVTTAANVPHVGENRATARPSGQSAVTVSTVLAGVPPRAVAGATFGSAVGGARGGAFTPVHHPETGYMTSPYRRFAKRAWHTCAVESSSVDPLLSTKTTASAAAIGAGGGAIDGARQPTVAEATMAAKAAAAAMEAAKVVVLGAPSPAKRSRANKFSGAAAASDSATTPSAARATGSTVVPSSTPSEPAVGISSPTCMTSASMMANAAASAATAVAAAVAAGDKRRPSDQRAAAAAAAALAGLGGGQWGPGAGTGVDVDVGSDTANPQQDAVGPQGLPAVAAAANGVQKSGIAATASAPASTAAVASEQVTKASASTTSSSATATASVPSLSTGPVAPPPPSGPLAPAVTASAMANATETTGLGAGTTVASIAGGAPSTSQVGAVVGASVTGIGAGRPPSSCTVPPPADQVGRKSPPPPAAGVSEEGVPAPPLPPPTPPTPTAFGPALPPPIPMPPSHNANVSETESRITGLAVGRSLDTPAGAMAAGAAAAAAVAIGVGSPPAAAVRFQAPLRQWQAAENVVLNAFMLQECEPRERQQAAMAFFAKLADAAGEPSGRVVALVRAAVQPAPWGSGYLVASRRQLTNLCQSSGTPLGFDCLTRYLLGGRFPKEGGSTHVEAPRVRKCFSALAAQIGNHPERGPLDYHALGVGRCVFTIRRSRIGGGAGFVPPGIPRAPGGPVGLAGPAGIGQPVPGPAVGTVITTTNLMAAAATPGSGVGLQGGNGSWGGNGGCGSSGGGGAPPPSFGPSGSVGGNSNSRSPTPMLPGFCGGSSRAMVGSSAAGAVMVATTSTGTTGVAGAVMSGVGGKVGEATV